MCRYIIEENKFIIFCNEMNLFIMIIYEENIIFFKVFFVVNVDYVCV